MQRGRGSMGDFFGFGDPFASLGSFGRPGRDPSDDPFFTDSFGRMMGPRLGRGTFAPGRNLFAEPVYGGFLEEQAPQPKKSKGPIIQELSSDDEIEQRGEEGAVKEDDSRKHCRSSTEPYVQDPDEEIEEKKSRHMQQRAEYKRPSTSQPQYRPFSFHSSTVTYGGFNGAYYTSSTTRRTGGDGVIVEESREADTTTGEATHRISRGLSDKGHSVVRKLNSDGMVDTVQTLHNLNEDEFAGFEEAWKGHAKEHLPGWNQGGDSVQAGQISRGWALPAAEQQQYAGPLGSKAHPPHQYFSNGRR